MGFLIVAAMLCLVRRTDAVAALLGDCSSDNCDTGLVCESDNTCRVKADGTATDCDSTNGNCPANAACSTTTCSCNEGYLAIAAGDTAGLCTVLGADCSSASCGDTTNYVCESNACKVKANGQATSCADDDDCVSNAVCDTDANTCSCASTYKHDAGLCILVIDSTCDTASDCSALSNTQCLIVSPCQKGICACATDYWDTDCTKLGYDKTCTTDDDKCHTAIGLECNTDTTKCACSADGHSYKTEIGRCTDQKLLGESCTGAGTGDCYTTTNSECDSTCKCSTGYIQDGESCRRPFAGESCSNTCDKVPTSIIFSGTESSQQTPTCTDDTCGCVSNEEVSGQIGSTCYTVCLSEYSGTAKDVGETCTSFHECSSKVCGKCPGDDNNKCYEAPCDNGSVGMAANRIAICISVLLLLHIF